MSTETATQFELGVSGVVKAALDASFRNALKKCADDILRDFDEIAALQPEERAEYIYKLFGCNNEDIIKINKGTKKTATTSDNTDADKPKQTRTRTPKEKVCPMPFLPQLVDKTKCHGLKTKYLTQCPNPQVEGSVYCKTCKKQADENEAGCPKMGEIESRIQQFKQSYYDYVSPVTNKAKHIYYLRYLEKDGFTQEQAEEILASKGINTTTEQMQARLWWKPQEKAKKAKVIGTKKRDTRPQPEEDDGYETDKTNYTTDNDEDYDDAGRPEPEPEPAKYNVGQQVWYIKGDKKYDAKIIAVEYNEQYKYTLSVTTQKGTKSVETTEENIEAKPETKPKSRYIVLQPWKDDNDDTKIVIVREQYNDDCTLVIPVYEYISGTQKNDDVVIGNEIGNYNKVNKEVGLFEDEW